MNNRFLKAYHDLCEEQELIPGSPEALYAFKEYLHDIHTLKILIDLEESDERVPGRHRRAR